MARQGRHSCGYCREVLRQRFPQNEWVHANGLTVAEMHRTPQSIKDDEWYEAVADALHILGKRWNDDTTLAEDAFILAYADELAERPAHEMPCARCSSAAGKEIVHGILECPRRDLQ